jgi:hypothetical protein
MTSIHEDICDCRHFDEGDWVVCRLNGSVFGIVVGESEFGRFYNVQLVDTLEIKAFHGVTLRHMEFMGEPPTEASAPVPTGDGSNIIYANFGAHTETKGAA